MACAGSGLAGTWSAPATADGLAVETACTLAWLLRGDWRVAHAGGDDFVQALDGLEPQLEGQPPSFGLFFGTPTRHVNGELRAIRRRFPELAVAGLVGPWVVSPDGDHHTIHFETSVLVLVSAGREAHARES